MRYNSHSRQLYADYSSSISFLRQLSLQVFCVTWRKELFRSRSLSLFLSCSVFMGLKKMTPIMHRLMVEKHNEYFLKASLKCFWWLLVYMVELETFVGIFLQGLECRWALGALMSVFIVKWSFLIIYIALFIKFIA